VIVVGVDFSPGSAGAVEFARSLAASRSTELRLIHVMPVPSGPWHPGEVERAWLEGLELSNEDIALRRGVPWVELVRAAEESRALFVVAGTHGSTGFQPFRLGNTASKLALRSRSPVVLVPAGNDNHQGGDA